MSNAPSETLNDKYLRLIGIPVSVIALLMAQMPFYFPNRWDLFWKYTLIGVFFTVSMWEISRIVLIRVRHRFPALAQTKQRVGWTFLLFVIQMGIGQAMITLAVLVSGLAAVSSFSFVQIWLINFACSLFFIVVISSVYEAIYFFEQYRNALQKAEHLQREQAQQRLDTLKNRVNPHFLFNSLTTLSALIGEDPSRAEQFVDELSKVYRYLLRAGRQPTVTLGEELQFAESYAFLLKNRFEAGAFSIARIDGVLISAAHNIPVLSLQNALDYCVRTQNAPLQLQISTLKNQLCIACNHLPKTLSFDVIDNDWKHLESNGALQIIEAGQLIILIPLQSTPVSI